MNTIRFYENNAEAFFERNVGVDVPSGWKAFVELLPEGGRILDAGCGSGRDALFFHRAGFHVTATEASGRLAELARAHTGLSVQVMTFDQMDWRETFDGIWACASLLHVPRNELSGVMRRLRDSLATRGALWMSFKYGAGEREADGRHFTDLDEAGAEALLAEAGGLELISLSVGGDSRPERAHEKWLNVLCRKTA